MIICLGILLYFVELLISAQLGGRTVCNLMLLVGGGGEESQGPGEQEMGVSQKEQTGIGGSCSG